MLSSIKKLIGTAQSTEARSVDLAAALEAARAEVVAAQNQHDVAGRAYNEGLLHLDETELHNLIGDTQKATIRRDRAQMLVGLLETKLAAAIEGEAVAALTGERNAVEREAADAAAAIRVEYPKLAKALVALLVRVENADLAARAVNKKLVAAGRAAERVGDVQKRAMPAGKTYGGDDFTISGPTFLLEIPGFAPGWDALERQRTRDGR